MTVSQHILIVEDDAAFATILRINLSKMGYSVQTASNGCAAWEYAQQKQFDLVMTDYHVPVLTGADLCRRLRADARYLETPIILVTGSSPSPDLARLNDELKLAAIVTKPFDMKVLLDIVSGCLADSAAVFSCLCPGEILA